MRNLLFWIVIYTLVLAYSQVLLKIGLNQLGPINIRDGKDVLPVAFSILTNFSVVFGVVLMASSFFLWIYILSGFNLSIAFPLTALVYVFVAILSALLLKEKLYLYNYSGILLIAIGIFFLLYKHQ
jgi:drug/metabolite transporter (DMT)-like permease